MPDRLCEVGGVIRVLVIIRPAGFSYQILSECVNQKRSLICMVMVKIRSGAVKEDDRIFVPAAAENGVALVPEDARSR